ncbi:MAG: hypothetical protein QW717_07220 [Candidatus Bathyarchaeia archaeon]
MQLIKQIKIRQLETRLEDAWFDLGLRQMQMGPVSFYKVKDPVTGEWLFKICRDAENKKAIVKALKCPSGLGFAQLEGNSMVFQESVVKGMVYDVLSLTEMGENGKLVRKVPASLDEVPDFIREGFEVKSYMEAAGKQAPGKHLATLCRSNDEKAMITLFLLEKAWTIAPTSPEEKIREIEERKPGKPGKAKRFIDTSHVLTCPVCGEKHRLIHVEIEERVKHSLKKQT